MRKKKRENSAILGGRGSRKKGSKSQTQVTISKSKSNNRRRQPKKSYKQMRTLPVAVTQEQESASMVDDFCKGLYDFLGESKTESQCRN